VSAPETLTAELERLVRREQRDKRLPSIAAAVVRGGELAWETAVGIADVGEQREATPDTQYRVGSITKTFTAAAILQLRDAGRLDLEDTLDQHVEGVPHAPSLRRLLSHTSGLQRETHDDAWLTKRFVDAAELVETLERAEQVLPPGARFHYSNLAFALLGIVVEHVSGLAYPDYVRRRLLEPLGLERTSFEPQAPVATGYLVQPYADGVWDEAPLETGAWIAAGQLWGTVRDFFRWAAFLADPDESVLSRASVEEMRTVQTIDDHERWTSGYGLGLGLRREGERVLAGHGGSMPGFIAGVLVSPRERVGAAVLTNSSTARIAELVPKLVTTTADRWPVPPEPWRVEEPPPPGDVAPLLGLWFLEADEVVFSWRNGRLEARAPDDPAWKPPSVFAREGEDRWRTESGAEHGEALRLERDDEGRIVRMVWAGYPVTREPATMA
jgi:CubicO group peptidase (beta-lactamase class C family)